MKLSVYDKQGQSVGEVDFDESCLGKFVNYKLLHAAVMMYEANLRQGTVKTKNIREVSGKSAKPYKQKGTGRARMGRVRRFGSRGGATAFG
ncbi:MAG: 50S ribosomal protein L4, partial [Clostridium sp.]|nr:50S ribosomal protein L4 [Clostridium sp.]